MKLEQLKFGTSGLRGPVSAFLYEDCVAYAISFARLLKQQFPQCKAISLAGDLRSSTPMISEYFLSTLVAEGFEVQNLGFVPTPTLALWASEKKQAAVMVTGSHIPADQNGVKFYTPAGEITKSDEAFIHQQYIELKSTTFSSVKQSLPIDRPIQNFQREAEDFYLRRYQNFFGEQSLQGLKIAFYQHSSVGREVLPQILKSLGAEVRIFGWSSEFIPVDTENVKNVSNLLIELQEFKADVLFSTDGDADRPLVIDSKFGLVRGDLLGIITSQLLGIKRIATPVSSTSLIEEIQYFDKVERTKIGSPFVISGLEKLALDSAEPCAGFEANGGYLLAGSIVNLKGQTLQPLMTRDCLLPMVAFAVSRVQSRLESLFQSFGEKSNLSGLVPQFPREISSEIIGILRKDPATFLQQDTALFESFGNLKSVDLLDGVKVISNQSETLHFRPSGNAPEFRVYVEANSAERAQDFLDRSLGICRRFLSDRC